MIGCESVPQEIRTSVRAAPPPESPASLARLLRKHRLREWPNLRSVFLFMGLFVCIAWSALFVFELALRRLLHGKNSAARPGGGNGGGNWSFGGLHGCESCHGPGSLHVSSGGGAKTIINPRKDPETCFQCHLEIRAKFNLPYRHPVPEGRVSCGDCHNPHKGSVCLLYTSPSPRD